MRVLLFSATQASAQPPVPGCNTPETQALPFCDTSLSLEDRVNNLISLLMPEEKVSCQHSYTYA